MTALLGGPQLTSRRAARYAADLGGSAVCDVRLPTRRDGSLWCLGGIVNAGWQTEQGRAYVRRGLPQMGVIYLSARD